MLKLYILSTFVISPYTTLYLSAMGEGGMIVYNNFQNKP
jgi:hypothetical protein